MAPKRESLINPQTFDYSLLETVFDQKGTFDFYLAFDEEINALLVTFDDPKKIESVIYYVNDQLAMVINDSNKKIMGFWLINFSKHWLEMDPFSEIKPIWDDVVKLGLLSKFRKYERSENKKAEKPIAVTSKKIEKKAVEWADDLFNSSELKQQLCPSLS